MLASIRGIVADKPPQGVIIDVQGLGYLLQTTSVTQASLELKQTVHLDIYEHIRQDNHDLYGFLDRPTKQLFELLLSVNGLGPKMALAVMDLSQVDGLKTAIAGGDVAYLTAASGVGKRLAERIVVDLKDKVGLLSSQTATDFLQSKTDEALEALTALGFSLQDAAASLKGVDRDLPTEERVKRALKGEAN